MDWTHAVIAAVGVVAGLIGKLVLGGRTHEKEMSQQAFDQALETTKHVQRRVEKLEASRDDLVESSKQLAESNDRLYVSLSRQATKLSEIERTENECQEKLRAVTAMATGSVARIVTVENKTKEIETKLNGHGKAGTQ